MADCTITGEILNANNELAEGIRVYCVRLVGADLITDAEQKLIATSDEDGLVSFVLPQGSTAYLSGNFFVNGTSFNVNDGVALSIPASSTADLIDLAAVASFPDDGAIVQDDGVALPLRIGTFNFGAGIAAVPGAAGVATITAAIASTEAVQDALTTFFPDSGPYDWTYSDAGNAVGLVIAPATTSVNGLMSAADKTAFDLIGARNAANGYAGLSASGLLTESQMPSSIARDSEVTALTDALTVAVALKADLASPALSGTPTAPTAASVTSSTQLATTAFVHALITDLIGGAPTALDTLIEISNQLATDESAVSALTVTVGGKLAKASNLSDLTDAGAARGSLGLVAIASSGSASDLSAGTIPDARFPATLPALSGENLTALNASNISSGILATARGGFGTDMSAAAGVALFAAGVPTLTGTSGTGNFARVASPTFETPVLGVASATSITASGAVTGSSWLGSQNIQAGGTGYIYFNARTSLNSPSDGILRLTNFAESDFNRLQFGGTSSSFPALKRSATSLICRLADDSADALFQASVFKTSTALVTSFDGASDPAFLVNSIGSTGGPATAAQNGWLKFQDSGGATCWVPIWK